MLRCKQVSTLVAGDGLTGAGAWLRFRVHLHLVMCRHCARYAAQIRMLGARARECFGRAYGQPGIEELQRRILDAAAELTSSRGPS
jgi:hypothetical protein